MSITDELREWYKDRLFMGNGWAEIDAIADRIDAAHRSALEKLAAQLDESGALPMTDENMAEHGWVRLPVDADGVPIHMGDVVRYDNLGNKGEPFEVKEITYRMGCEDEVGDGEQYGTIVAVTTRHHHAPTVEDVLREFVQEMYEHIGMYEADDIDANEWRDADNKTIAEYAAKLQLREDA